MADRNQENNMADEIMREEHHINEAAEEVIEESEHQQREFKLKVLAELMGYANQVCEECDLSYFAIGHLLALAEYGEDTYPGRNTYIIGMLREDYDVFFREMAERAEEFGIKVSPMYAKNGRIVHIHSTISIDRTEENEEGYLHRNLILRVEPYEYLPADAAKRKAFQDQIALRHRKYRIASRKYGNAKSILERAERKYRYLFQKDYFQTWNEKYRAFIDCYADLKNPQYAGRVELLVYPEHRMDEIFPVHKGEYKGISIMVPADTEAFVIHGKEQKEQEGMEARLLALRTFDELCTEHGITYTVMNQLSSSCSHVGDYEEETKFAVWRIGLLREDYERAVALLKQEEDRLPIMLLETLYDYPLVHDTCVRILAKSDKKRNPGEETRSLVLVPFDDLPESYEDYNRFIREVNDVNKSFRRLISAEKGLTKDPRTEETDTWAEFTALQELRAAYSSKGIKSQKIYTIFDQKPRIYVRSEIFPVVRRPFHDFSVTGPANPYLWHEKKDDVYTEYITERRCGILKVIDRICTEQEIPYFAMSTLLIGAVIYHDYVPQVNSRAFEVGMLREDYERFFAYAREHIEEYGMQLNEFRDKERQLPRLNKTISLPGEEDTSAIVRILPFDKVPEDFYLYQGFIRDMNRMNDRMRVVVNAHEWRIFNSLTHNPITREMKKQYNARRLDLKTLKDKTGHAGALAALTPLEMAGIVEKRAQLFRYDGRTDTYARVCMGRSKKISGSELFPLQRVKFRDFEINCPHDYSVWQPMLNDELRRQVSCIQKADLILIRELDRVCTELGIGYFICGGTMLGYMRHEGFIPWDDDVDVAMLRADYNRFLKEAGPLLGEGFFLQTRESDPNIPYLFSKIRLNNTEYVTEYNENRDFHKGICLDLFPFDFLPSRPDSCQPFIKEVLSLSDAHNRVANHQYGEPWTDLRPANSLEASYLREQKAELERYWRKDLRESQERYIAAATRYNAKAEELGLTVVASFVPSFTWIDLNDLLPYQRGTFEGIEVSVPKRPDVFLTMQYGNFMELPPVHMQVAHRLIRWSTWEDSWDRPPAAEETPAPESTPESITGSTPESTEEEEV